jgi:hypothetical protein
MTSTLATLATIADALGEAEDEVATRDALATICACDAADAEDIADTLAELGDVRYLPLLARIHGLPIRADGSVVPRDAVWETCDGETWQDSDDCVETATADDVLDGLDPASWSEPSDETQYWDLTARLVVVTPEGLADEISESRTVAVHPPEPSCDECEHEWCSPLSVVGGHRDNPGVFGHDGGVIIREVCRHCAAYRVTDTWAQNPATGEQGLESVTYEEADEDSRAWAASCRD